MKEARAFCNILSSSPKLRIGIYVGVLLLLAAIYLPVLTDFPIGAYVDDGIYASLAESIANGDGYRRANDPFAIPEYQYPPGYPVLLALDIKVFPHSLFPLRLVSLLSTMATVYLSYFLWKDQFPVESLLMVALVAVHPWVIAHSGMAMSEPAYMFFSLAAIYCYQRALKEERVISSHFIIPCVILTWMSYYIRSIGIALILSITIDRFLKKDWIGGIILGTILNIAPLVWSIRNSILGQQLTGKVYGTAFSNLAPNLVLHNAHLYISRFLPEALLPGFSSPNFWGMVSSTGFGWTKTLITLLLWLILLVGMWRLSLTYFYSQSILYILIYYVGILCVPWPDGQRYLLPILPILLIAFLSTFKTLDRFQMPAMLGKIPMVLFASLAIFGCTYIYISGVRTPARTQIRDMKADTEWIRTNVDRDAILVARYPASVYLYAEHPTIDYPDIQDVDHLIEFLRKKSAKYLLIAPKLVFSERLVEDEYLVNVIEPLMRNIPDCFRVEHSDDTNLVRVWSISDECKRYD